MSSPSSKVFLGINLVSAILLNSVEFQTSCAVTFNLVASETQNWNVPLIREKVCLQVSVPNFSKILRRNSFWIFADGVSRADDADLAEDNRMKTSITTIPSEIQILIFKKFDRVSSTCLGLISRHFQNIHKNSPRTRPNGFYVVLPPTSRSTR
jgi:hypothetical protein